MMNTLPPVGALFQRASAMLRFPRVTINFCAAAWLLLVAVLAALGLFWTTFDHPYFYRQFDAHVATDVPIYPGQSVDIDRTYCGTINRALVVVKLVGPSIVPVTSHEFVGFRVPCEPVEARREKLFPFQIPPGVTPGHYEYEAFMEIEQNWVRVDRIDFPHIGIEVLERPKP